MLSLGLGQGFRAFGVQRFRVLAVWGVWLRVCVMVCVGGWGEARLSWLAAEAQFSNEGVEELISRAVCLMDLEMRVPEESGSTCVSPLKLEEWIRVVFRLLLLAGLSCQGPGSAAVDHGAGNGCCGGLL